MSNSTPSATTAPPKARKRRKDARPQEIVAAAMAEFATHGFAATRLEDIASRAGVVKGTIYLYFANKEALFQEVVRANVLPTIAPVQDMIAQFSGPTDALVEMVLRRMYGQMLGPDLAPIVRIIITEGGRFPDIATFYYEEVVSKGEELLRSLLERGVASGEFERSAIVDEQMILAAPVVSAVVWRTTFDVVRPLEVERYIEAHIEMALNGLRVRS